MVASLALLALRIIAASMFAAGVAAFAAAAVTLFLGALGGRSMAALLVGPSLTLGLILLVAAAGMALLMPRRNEIVRQLPPAGPVPAVVVWLLVGLCLAAAARLPGLASWGQAGIEQVSELTGDGPDPLGLSLIVLAIMLASPVLAALTVVSCAATSALGLVARATATSRVLGAGVALQTGLVAAGHVVRQQVAAMREGLRPFLDDMSAAAVSARLEDWFARHDLMAAASNRYLLLVLGGYILACAVSASRASRPALPPAPANPPGRAASAVVAPGPAADRSAEPSAVPAPPAATPVSSAAPAFESSSYVVRPRIVWWQFLSGRYWDYEIHRIPPSSREQYGFSWRNGVLRRQPGGPELLKIHPARRPGRFFAPQYHVQDAATGQNVGRLVPRASDWEILDARDQTMAYALEVVSGFGVARYRIKAGEEEVCRVAWTIQGPTVVGAELDVEFLSGTGSRFDRGLAMALMPILEQQARLKSERHANS